MVKLECSCITDGNIKWYTCFGKDFWKGVNQKVNGCNSNAHQWMDKQNVVYPYSRIFSLVTQSCPTLCDPMNHSTPGLPVHHQLPEFTQTHVHRVGDTIQPSHPLLSPSPPAPNPSQHQGLFQWVNSSHEVAKALKRKEILIHAITWMNLEDTMLNEKSQPPHTKPCIIPLT